MKKNPETLNLNSVSKPNREDLLSRDIHRMIIEINGKMLLIIAKLPGLPTYVAQTLDGRPAGYIHLEDLEDVA
ncbi:MAG: hypothetical protein N4A36_02490 [Candidatus Gracilibacteria bacterium]|jgi:hypothetical protein|nr:hypothetical protein [Candidatus Gracilibacteria bacterium]